MPRSTLASTTCCAKAPTAYHTSAGVASTLGGKNLKKAQTRGAGCPGRCTWCGGSWRCTTQGRGRWCSSGGWDRGRDRGHRHWCQRRLATCAQANPGNGPLLAPRPLSSPSLLVRGSRPHVVEADQVQVISADRLRWGFGWLRWRSCAGPNGVYLLHQFLDRPTRRVRVVGAP